MSLLAALCAGALVWSLARRAAGASDRQLGTGPLGLHTGARLGTRKARARYQEWLLQAGAAVSPGQFLAVSAGVGLSCFLLLLAVSRTLVVAGLPAIASAAMPYFYWSAQRRKRSAALSAAWPDALRYLVGALGAGISTLHDALQQLAVDGPAPLRGPMARCSRLAGKLGDRQALEAVREELADPISDQVILALEGAVDEGTETVLTVLADLGSQITADLQLADKVRTLQAQSRVATWGCLVVPYGLLIFLCATNASYRHFFSEPIGLLLVVAGAAMSAAGAVIARRLVRPIATTKRVFAEAGAP
ncbi:MAG: type II secretion system F family protein [Acidimicrobiales bacterium]